VKVFKIERRQYIRDETPFFHSIFNYLSASSHFNSPWGLLTNQSPCQSRLHKKQPAYLASKMVVPASPLATVTMMLLAMLFAVSANALAKEDIPAINTGQTHRPSTTTFHLLPHPWTTSRHAGLSTVTIVVSSAYVPTSPSPSPSVTTAPNIVVPPINAPSNVIALTSVIVSLLACFISLVNVIWSNKKTSGSREQSEVEDDLIRLNNEIDQLKQEFQTAIRDQRGEIRRDPPVPPTTAPTSAGTNGTDGSRRRSTRRRG
jgi:hypothetical protein